MKAWLAAGMVAASLVTGCGHAVEPRAPHDDAAGVPPPRALSARVEVSRGVVLNWSATSADRAIVDGWSVERRLATETAFTSLTEAPIADTMFVDGGLADGVRAVYRVRGVTAAGVAGVPVETPAVRGDLLAPTAPVSVMAATDPAGIALTFTPGPEPDLALFEARLLPTAGGAPLFRPLAGSPALLGGLVAGAEYAIEVTAIDSAGRVSPPSAPPAVAVAGP
jgi:hypothetical protein